MGSLFNVSNEKFLSSYNSNLELLEELKVSVTSLRSTVLSLNSLVSNQIAEVGKHLKGSGSIGSGRAMENFAGVLKDINTEAQGLSTALEDFHLALENRENYFDYVLDQIGEDYLDFL